MITFKTFLEFKGYAGPGGMMDNQGIPRNLMKTILSGEVFMLGNEGSGQIKINDKIYSVPVPVRFETDDDNFQTDKDGNFLRGTMIVMAGELPTQTNKVGKVSGGHVVQNPGTVEHEKVTVNAEQLKDLLTTGFQQAASNPMGAMGGGMPGGGMGGF